MMIGVVRCVVAFVFLLFVKFPIGIEVITGAEGRRRSTASAPAKPQRAPVIFIPSSTR